MTTYDSPGPEPGATTHDDPPATTPQVAVSVADGADSVSLTDDHHANLAAVADLFGIPVRYGSSTVKRFRRTRDELDEVDSAIAAAVVTEHPVSLRSGLSGYRVNSYPPPVHEPDENTLDRLLHATEEILAELRYLRRRLPKAPAPDPFDLAEQLRRIRAESGLTLRALEEQIGVPFNCLSRVERGVGLASPVNMQRIRNWLTGYEPR